MHKIVTGFKLGKNPVEVIERLGEVHFRLRCYRVLKVRVGGDQEYISLRIYNQKGKFIKQFMMEPEVTSSIGDILCGESGRVGKVSTQAGETISRLTDALNEAEKKAWDSLARYKFQMFGYWASIWVHLNRISGENRPNPWKPLISQAKRKEAR